MPFHYPHLVGAFVVTAAWDVVLRLFAERRVRFLGIEDWRWVVTLRPYFEAHTVLAAALIAGFVGAVAYALIAATPGSSTWSLLPYLAWVTLVSGVVGIPMRHSGLFPHLKRHYYDELGFGYSFATDAFSGVVVCATMLALQRAIVAPKF
jgi:hypothetical protein